MELLMDSQKIHEECGVIGIYSPAGDTVTKDIYYGLIALQHRGQESAGISVSDTDGLKGNMETHKGMGLVSEIFTGEEISKLRGNIGVGHVRYSTTGESNIKNAQPIAMNYIKGSLALVHNGNIINAQELKKEQLYRGQAHFSTSDTEVLAYEIISERIHTETIEDAIKITSRKIRGGYALIVMSPRKLIAIRDPLGIKPLTLGKKKDAYILSSESAAIESIGGNFIRDIQPGEIVSVTKDGIQSDTSLCRKKKAHCIFEYIYFARTDSIMDGIGVRDARFRAGQALASRDAEELKKEKTRCPDFSNRIDLVAGVPDSGLVAAEGYAFESGIPLASIFHKNNYIGRSFIKPTDKERKDAVQMKLSVLQYVVKGKRILLIDDSIVRGTTMNQIIRALRKAGAREIHVRISSPPFLYPCYYGTDVPSSHQLIAADHSSKEICKRIHADSLAYLKIEDFGRMTGCLSLCKACFDGNYPI